MLSTVGERYTASQLEAIHLLRALFDENGEENLSYSSTVPGTRSCHPFVISLLCVLISLLCVLFVDVMAVDGDVFSL